MRDIIKLFCDSTEYTPLLGGQGTSVKAGNVVIKPVEDEQYYIAISRIWNALAPSNYKIARHVASKNNNFVEMGYGATAYLDITENRTAVEEKLVVSEQLHRDLRGLGVETLPYSNDPWTKANKILWHNGNIEDFVFPEGRAFVKNLVESLSKVNDKYQLVHADLEGNILFEGDNTPVVIDFSPTIAPVKFADSIIVCDAITWANVPVDALQLLQPFDVYKEYIKYAIAFRTITIACNNDKGFEDVMNEWNSYKRIWDIANEHEMI